VTATTQHQQLVGVYRGVVSRTNDPEGRGRVKVVCPAVNGRSELAWALTNSPQPLVAGTPVWVTFEHGDSDFPVVLGGWKLPPPPASAPTGRFTATYTTAALGAGDTEVGMVPLATSYRVLRVETSAPALVRLYASDADRVADAGRLPSTDPSPGVGIVLEVLTVPELLAFNTSPLIDGASMEGTPSALIPITVTPTGAGSITVTLTCLRTE